MSMIDTGIAQNEAPQAVGATVSIELRLKVEEFMYDEAELLDSRQFTEWLALWTDDAEYFAPIRITRKMGHSDLNEGIGHFDENRASLALRVRRLGTDVAWAEDPPSLTRRYITNVKVQFGELEGELNVRSNLLMFRSRGDRGHHELIACQRHDVLRSEGPSFRLARRRILLDQASLGTKNLAVFL